MNGQDLREARRKKGWTQVETAEKLGVTQAYLSMLERGRRTLPYDLARLAVETLHAPPTALPLRDQAFAVPVQSGKLSLQLAALGYPGFAHLRAKAQHNPAEVLLTALNAANLDDRVTEGLPWLALAYADMDWDWAVQNAKLLDRQNRLGLVVTLASQGGYSLPRCLDGSGEKMTSNESPRYSRALESADGHAGGESYSCHTLAS